jgi:hypothetical protein
MVGRQSQARFHAVPSSIAALSAVTLFTLSKEIPAALVAAAAADVAIVSILIADALHESLRA